MGSQTDRNITFDVALDSKLQSTEVLSAKQKSFIVIEISQFIMMKHQLKCIMCKERKMQNGGQKMHGNKRCNTVQLFS